MDALWAGLTDGRTAIAPIRRFDPTGFGCRVAAEVPDDPDAGGFDIRAIVPKSYRKATKVMARDIELAVVAAATATADAGLVTKATLGGVGEDAAAPTLPPDRMGCHIGAGLLAAETDELTEALVSSRHADGSFDVAAWGAGGMNNLTPLWLLKYLPNMLACHVTIIHDCQGPSNTITCAEASGTLSIGESMRVIERGDADACLSGGAETKVHLMGLLRQQFADRLVTSVLDDDPAEQVRGVRPFDAESRGTVLGEGGGLLVLEAIESADRRGAKIRAEVAGFGASQTVGDESGPVLLDPEPDGESIAWAIDTALADAGLVAEAVDAILPLGCGIPRIDAAEVAALQRIFGDRLSSIPLITPIPAIGNCCAGSGAVGAAIAAQCLHTQRLPARLNSGRTPGVDAGAVASRAADLNVVLVVSTSFGGQNAALLLRRYG